MKIMYVDIEVRGHHYAYFKSLCNSQTSEPVIVLPQKVENINAKQYVYKNKVLKKRSFIVYIKWIKEILKIAKKEKPDIIHFLFGDMFYRYFGYGLRKFKKYKTVVTFHVPRSKKIQTLSIKRITGFFDVSVVHSDYIKQLFTSFGVKKKCISIGYPCFNIKFVDKGEACKFWGLDQSIPTITSIGTTEYYKGLDILLEALNNVNVPFQLLIAGRGNYFSEEYVTEKTADYKDKVFANLHFLSENELNMAVNASDIIVLPYRKSFSGASGPLAEGVQLNKCIVGPSHGNLSDTITQNNLGYVFESEDVVSLTKTLNFALTHSWKRDSKYLWYREKLDPQLFNSEHQRIYYELLK